MIWHMLRPARAPWLLALAAFGLVSPAAEAQVQYRPLRVVPDRVYLRPARAPRTAPPPAPTTYYTTTAAPRVATPAPRTGYVRTQAVAPAPLPTPDGLERSPMLGTFYPEPQITMGGNNTSGGSGYTPMSGYGWGEMGTYGPFSAFRATSAPVTTVTRGYNGIATATESTSFSYPFQPALSPVVYPTRSQQRGAAPVQYTPPNWDSGFNWVDQN